MLYEVVTGQILLSRRKQFFDLHQNVLLPIMQKIGIRPKLLLITEIGRHGRFLDIYEYKDFADYENLTNQLIEHPDCTLYELEGYNHGDMYMPALGILLKEIRRILSK